MKLCTFQKSNNRWIGVEFVLGLTRVSGADPVDLQELLQLWQASPRAAGKRHATDTPRGPLTHGLEYLITVRGLHGHDALLRPITFKCSYLLSVIATLSCRQPFVHDQRIDIP